MDMFLIEAVSLVMPTQLVVCHDGIDDASSWFLEKIIISHDATEVNNETKIDSNEPKRYCFECNG